MEETIEVERVCTVRSFTTCRRVLSSKRTSLRCERCPANFRWELWATRTEIFPKTPCEVVEISHQAGVDPLGLFIFLDLLYRDTLYFEVLDALHSLNPSSGSIRWTSQYACSSQAVSYQSRSSWIRMEEKGCMHALSRKLTASQFEFYRAIWQSEAPSVREFCSRTLV